MKIVLNRAYGAFHLPRPYAVLKNISVFDDSFEIRTDPELIEYITNHPWLEFKVVEFPDEATDFDVDKDDNYNEKLIYVINGKIHYA